MKLILASKSPRRKKILSKLDIPFNVIPSQIDESAIKHNKEPAKYAQTLATMKCEEVSEKFTNHTVIGADTIVVINETILGKPKNKNDAQSMLETLSGQIHEVITAVSVKNLEQNINCSFVELTKVSFYNISKNNISYYLNSNAPYDKAGAYGIQDWSSIFVEKINGCYENVVGFPLSRFVMELEKIGINFHEIP